MIELGKDMLAVAEGKQVAVVILLQDDGEEGVRIANVVAPHANDMMRSSLEHSSLSIATLAERMEA